MQVTRTGAYGVLLKDDAILLTKNTTGPFKGLWGLPGGGVESGEKPEEALRRELLEEVALEAGRIEPLNGVTTQGSYENDGKSHNYYYVGHVYRVMEWSERKDLVAEDEHRWVNLRGIDFDLLSPFAKEAVNDVLQTLTWRPKEVIRGKAIALAKHENRLLVCEVLNDNGKLKGWCPPGGGIEFGERSDDALKREIMEELQCSLKIVEGPMVSECIYEHHGHIGHEIIFAYDVTFDDPAIYAKRRIPILEQNGSTVWAEWVDIDRFRNGKEVLYPEAIKAKVIAICQ